MNSSPLFDRSNYILLYSFKKCLHFIWIPRQYCFHDFPWFSWRKCPKQFLFCSIRIFPRSKWQPSCQYAINMQGKCNWTNDVSIMNVSLEGYLTQKALQNHRIMFDHHTWEWEWYFHQEEENKIHENQFLRWSKIECCCSAPGDCLHPLASSRHGAHVQYSEIAPTTFS